MIRTGCISMVLGVCICVVVGIPSARCGEDAPVPQNMVDSHRTTEPGMPPSADSIGVDDMAELPSADSLGVDETGGPAVADTVGVDEQREPAVADTLGIPEPEMQLGRAGIMPAAEMLESTCVARISAADLHELSSASPAEALIGRSEMRVTALGSHGLPRFLSPRAGRPDEVVYLLDGVPVSDRQLEVFDLNWLPLAGMSGVEIFRGGASSLHGSGAVSGVLNVTPLNAVSEIPLSDVSVWWGGFGSRAISLALRRSLADRLGVLGAYENVRSDGWIDDSSFEAEKMFGKLHSEIGRGRTLDIAGFRYKGKVELPDSCPSLVDTHPGKRDDTREFVKVSILGGATTAYRVNCYRFDASQTVASGDLAYTIDGVLTGVDATLVRGPGSPTVSSLGIGFRRRDMTDSGLGDKSSNDVHIFAHKELESSRWRISGRVRVEKNSDFDTEVAPSLAARLFVRDGQTVFIKIDRSFAFPALINLYGAGREEVNGWDPEAEHSVGVEVGASLDRGPWAARLAVYWTGVKDMIVWRRDESCRLAKSNDAEVVIKGLETSADFKHPAGFEGSVSYTLSSAVDESGDDAEYKPSSSLAWRLRAHRRLSDHIGTGLTFAGRWVSSVSAGDQFAACSDSSRCLNDTTLPGYTSAVIYGYLAIDRARVFVRITNVLDAEIYPRWGLHTLPSRSYELGVSWELVD